MLGATVLGAIIGAASGVVVAAALRGMAGPVKEAVLWGPVLVLGLGVMVGASKKLKTKITVVDLSNADFHEQYALTVLLVGGAFTVLGVLVFMYRWFARGIR